MKVYPSQVDSIPGNTFTVSSSQKLLADIKENYKKLEEKFNKTMRRSNINIRNSLKVDEYQFYAGLPSDMKDASDYFINKIRTLSDADQLLMLLHGQPGSGKTFFVGRIHDHTNLRMKITASSRLEGMSLGCST